MIDQFLEELFKLISAEFGWVAVLGLAVVGGVFGWTYWVRLGPASSYAGDARLDRRARAEYRKYYRGLVKKRAKPGQDIYARTMQGVLDRLDKWLGGPEPGETKSRHWGAYWSGVALDRALLLAVVYPVLSLFVIWFATGAVGPVEQVLGFESGASGYRRLFWGGVGLACWAGAIGCFQLGLRNDRGGWRAGAFAGALAGAGVVAFAFSGAGASVVVFAIAVALAVASAVVSTAVLALAFAFAFAFANTFTFTFAGAAVAAFAVAFAVVWLSNKGHSAWARVVLFLWLVIVLVGSVFTGVFSDGAWAGPADTRLLVIVLVGLPVLNALFDWGSLGVTRYLVQRGLDKEAEAPGQARHGWAMALSVLDLFIALCVLLVMVTLMIVYVAAFNHVAGAPVFDLDALIRSMESAPGYPALYWVYFMLFTTLIPSVLNGLVGAFALLRWVYDLSWVDASKCLPKDPRCLTPFQRGRWAGLVLGRYVLVAGLLIVYVWIGEWVLTCALPGLLEALLVLARWMQETGLARIGLGDVPGIQ